MNVTYRMVAGADFVNSGLAAKMKEMGEQLPNLLLTVAWIAEEDGKIVAFSVLQNVPMVEPFFAELGYGACLKELYAKTKSFILESGAPRVLMHTDNPAMKRMLTRDGAEILNEEFYQWQMGG